MKYQYPYSHFLLEKNKQNKTNKHFTAKYTKWHHVNCQYLYCNFFFKVMHYSLIFSAKLISPTGYILEFDMITAGDSTSFS